ncbi:MAG: RNA polymerase sigma-70 factor [Prolixibacteraceae bacterium]|jgi:RNA polymerase sigma-70 factor (ECF subfamily)
MTKIFKNSGEGTQQFILNELKKGNERAFDFIFKEYYKPLSQFSFSFIKDQDKAESLVQDVLIKLWEKRENLDNIDNLFSYLMVMVRNISIDYLRKEKTSQKIYRQAKSSELANTTEEHISRNEFEEKLLISVHKLPDRCRVAFELSRFESLTNKEIAENMKISVKGVEALIGRSLKHLRDELREFLPSYRIKKNTRNFILFSLFGRRISQL